MKPIMVVDKTNVQIKSETTTSVDIHLRENNQYVNIILPDGRILVVEPNGDVTSFLDDTQLNAYSFI